MEPDTSLHQQLPVALQMLIRRIASWTRFLGMALLLLGLLTLLQQGATMKRIGLQVNVVVNFVGVAMLMLAGFKLSSYSSRLKRALQTGTLASLTAAMTAHGSFWKHWFFYTLISAIGTVITLIQAEW
jgi:hypothetical protein